MELALVDPATLAGELERAVGAPPGSESGLAELVREEVHARGPCTRASALRAVSRRLLALVDDVDDRLQSVCEALEREGDLSVAPGGLLFPTPLRAVLVDHQALRLFSSLPTRRLAAGLGAELAPGLRRVWALSQEVVQAEMDRVHALGGVVLDAATWAGLDRAPPADAAWLQSLDRRLEHEPEPAGSLDHGQPLAWMGWSLTEGAFAWRRDPAGEARLWRARHPRRRVVQAWTAGGSPAETTFVSLRDEDGARTRFALAREAGAPLTLAVWRGEDETTLALPGWLPWAEHRYLSLRAEPAGDGAQPGRWRLPSARAEEVIAALRTRLGVTVVSQGEDG